MDHIDVLARRAATGLPTQFTRAEQPAGIEHLGGHTAIDMQFVIAVSGGFNFEEYRRKGNGNGRRREHDPAKEWQRIGIAAAGDQPHVPDDEALRIEIHGPDVQAPTALMRQRNLAQEGLVDVPLDQRDERARVGDAFAEQQLPDGRQEGAERENVSRSRGGIELAKRPIPGLPKKGERRHQGAGRYAGDHLEGRALASTRPAAQKAGTERSVGASTRQCKVWIENDTIRHRREIAGRFLGKGFRHVALHDRAWETGRRTHVWHARNGGVGHQFAGYAIAR